MSDIISILISLAQESAINQRTKDKVSDTLLNCMFSRKSVIISYLSQLPGEAVWEGELGKSCFQGGCFGFSMTQAGPWQWPGTACVCPVRARPGGSYSPTSSCLPRAPPLLSASAMRRMSCHFSAPVTGPPAAEHSGVPSSG